MDENIENLDGWGIVDLLEKNDNFRGTLNALSNLSNLMEQFAATGAKPDFCTVDEFNNILGFFRDYVKAGLELADAYDEVTAQVIGTKANLT